MKDAAAEADLAFKKMSDKIAKGQYDKAIVQGKYDRPWTDYNTYIDGRTAIERTKDGLLIRVYENDTPRGDVVTWAHRTPTGGSMVRDFTIQVRLERDYLYRKPDHAIRRIHAIFKGLVERHALDEYIADHCARTLTKEINNMAVTWFGTNATTSTTAYYPTYTTGGSITTNGVIGDYLGHPVAPPKPKTNVDWLRDQVAAVQALGKAELAAA
jgi:hypothetical protein